VRSAGLAVLILVAGLVSAAAVAAPAGAAGTRCRPNSERTLATATQATAATVRSATTAYRAPGSSPIVRLPRGDRYGFPTTLLALSKRVDAQCRATWYRVRLPVYPNNTTGWVPAWKVKLARRQLRIVVDVSARRLYLFRRGALVLNVPAAVGKPSTPTPLGRFYVTQRFVLPNSSGPYGPRALGISAFSDVLRSWRDGGPIGLHGTNEPFSVSRPVSHGCVRLANDAIIKLFRVTALGTPVQIRA
jgi:lipoprotein-anchoring transpeptidase ErfK/SrfK